MALRVVTALAGAKVGGAEAFFVALSGALARAGVQVHAVVKPHAGREAALRSAGVVSTQTPFRKYFDFQTGSVFRKLARGFKPHAVLAFAGRASALAPPGPYALIGRLGGYYNLKNFSRCDRLVCNAPDLVRYVVEGGWPTERVFHIPNFPNIEAGEPVSRDSLNTPKGVPVALALGRLHPNKALDVLIAAAAQVPDLWVWIAGEGPEGEKLEKFANELGVRERIKFLGWRNDRASLFKAADFCVYPSREEPFGNVVVEAWGYGTPLIATASSGPAWLIRNGDDAILTPVDEPDALADAIRRLLASPDKGARLAANGRKRIAAEFSEHAVVHRYIELFESVRA